VAVGVPPARMADMIRFYEDVLGLAHLYKEVRRAPFPGAGSRLYPPTPPGRCAGARLWQRPGHAVLHAVRARAGARFGVTGGGAAAG
jgi:hypothetical protein